MSTDPAALFSEITSGLARMFACFDIADEEEAKAAAVRPDLADVLHHAVPELCYPTHPLMSTPEVYRAHVAELLERVCAEEDTRPGTDAEMCCAFATVSPHNHLRGAANGLYARVFARVMPGRDGLDPAQYEWSEGKETIDAEERALRRKLSQPWRRMPATITCDGRHGGEPAACRYAPAGAGRLF